MWNRADPFKRWSERDEDVQRTGERSAWNATFVFCFFCLFFVLFFRGFAWRRISGRREWRQQHRRDGSPDGRLHGPFPASWTCRPGQRTLQMPGFTSIAFAHFSFRTGFYQTRSCPIRLLWRSHSYSFLLVFLFRSFPPPFTYSVVALTNVIAYLPVQWFTPFATTYEIHYFTIKLLLIVDILRLRSNFAYYKPHRNCLFLSWGIWF